MDGLLPIGAFSRATLISANTLRAYHESGLLEPAVVDPRTGYRGYRVAQFGDAAVIRHLRELDVPLAAIREILAARDPEVTRRLLAEHRDRMLERAAYVDRVLRTTGELLDAPEMVTPTAVSERMLPPVRAFSITREVAEDDFAGFLGEAYRQLATVAANGPPGAVFPAEYRDEPVPVTAYVPAGDGPTLLPGGRFAVTEFVGPYTDMVSGYRSLGAWLAGTGMAIAGAVRESYLVGPGDGVPEDAYRTEICWPLQLTEE
ncbi:MerR family transcriptional regulator [Actinoplanes sp. NPDC049802]|uniref:MerR family transcriptional regulator n=1 Tax=Actinoplanes sp. NPDC049802 TaxID=3154742 RepID=UPI0033CD509D